MGDPGLPLARIVGTGSYLPEQILSNADLELMVETSDDWIASRTGIRERRKARPDQAASDLAYEASLRALDMAGVKPEELDLIVVATISPDMNFPSTGCLLQERLGATQATGMDLSAACSGFLFGLHLLRNLIATGAAKRILLVGVEVLTKIINYEDRGTCVLFGDGAGAAVLVPETDGRHGVLATRIGSDGGGGPLLCLPAGGSRRPASAETVAEKLHFVQMKGNEVFKYAVRGMEDVMRGVLVDAHLESGDLDLLVPHQANIRMIQAIAERLDVPMEKVFLNIHKYGNTSAASVPIALDEAVREGRVKQDSLLGLVAFGGGLTWGAAAIRW